MKDGKGNYLDNLYEWIKDDSELEDYEQRTGNVKDAFKRLKRSSSNHLGLRDLETFGVESDVVARIGLIAFEYDRRSPQARNDDGSNPRGTPNFNGTITSEDSSVNRYDEDDFEDEGDTDNMWADSKHPHRHSYERGMKGSGNRGYNAHMAKPVMERQGSEQSRTDVSDYEEIYEDDEDTQHPSPKHVRINAPAEHKSKN